jgi:uncharacterized membrane protein YccC
VPWLIPTLRRNVRYFITARMALWQGWEFGESNLGAGLSSGIGSAGFVDFSLISEA